ncbi:MAG: acetate--CoA ligase [Bacteroidia bacterium]
MDLTINSFQDYNRVYKYSIQQPERFWAEVASSFLWNKKWEKVLEWEFKTPKVEWFKNAELNISYNCLDRHLAENGDKTAFIWEPNDPEEDNRKISYTELHEMVCRFANVLIANGVKKGDRVCIYLPMLPEAIVAMLACARVGAIHSVVFAGFSSQSVSDRINDSECSLVITTDGTFRGEKKIELKKIVDEALKTCPSVKRCIVYNNRNWEVNMLAGRDVWWHSEMKKVDAVNEPEWMNAEDPLFILYTSGSTGKPKGVLHTCGGYMVMAGYSFRTVFNYKAHQIFWCTADVGWVTGHTYIAYGTLLNAATTVIFEGIPSWPDAGRFWEVVDKHQVNIFYTAPTTLRSLMAAGDKFLEGKNLSSLEVLGTVGEPINEEAWFWYHDRIGKEHCPIVDTWWQTETGAIMMTPIAPVGIAKPGFAMYPMPGIQPILVDSKGNELTGNSVEGNLCMKFPWPSMSRTVYGDHERFRKNYFSTYENLYFTGDGCKRDEEGFYRITGRVDDVINVSGHRIGTGEVEDAINDHECVVESAVVGFPHDIKGQALYAFVICDKPVVDESIFKTEVGKIVSERIGSFAKPDKIQVVKALPKTRSGKIMRRILRKIAEGDISNLGDTTTLIDPTVVDAIKSGVSN